MMTRNFYACSVGEPGKDYDEENLQRIISKSAFILHKDTNQKGTYYDIKPGDILLLKYREQFVAYGEALPIITSTDEDWNLFAPVKSWTFKNDNNPSAGVPKYGIGFNTIGGGKYGTVKTLKESYAIKLVGDISNTTSLYKIILSEHLSRQTKTSMNPIITLLKYKKQIILQGPPGTGKTRLAKELAAHLIGIDETLQPEVISDDDIKNALRPGMTISSGSQGTPYKIEAILEDRIKFAENNGVSEDSLFTNIQDAYLQKKWITLTDADLSRTAADFAKYIFDIYQDKSKSALNESPQFKLIQFHPSYSYEDFVRGIVARPSESGEGILYQPEDKILARFAKVAQQNHLANRRQAPTITEFKFRIQLQKFSDEVRDALDKTGEFLLGGDTTAKIIAIVEDGFIYSFDKRKEIKYRLLLSDILKIEAHPSQINRSIDIRDIEEGYLKMQGKYPYYFRVYNLIKKIDAEAESKKEEITNLKSFVLIIDEINRANLSSVLGELIYALEYRNEPVESVYDTDLKGAQLLLPPNLYIIGTMNTADRSVGHIDYAIRRRFAFVDVLPKELADHFETALFKKVSEFFVKDAMAKKLEPSQHLSSEFRPEHVWLGHSYFIKKEGVDSRIRLKYEIIPILEEYIKDGVLKESKELRDSISNLENEIQ